MLAEGSSGYDAATAATASVNTVSLNDQASQSSGSVASGKAANTTNVTTTIIINSVTGTIECTTGGTTGTVTLNACSRGEPVEPAVYKILNKIIPSGSVKPSPPMDRCSGVSGVVAGMIAQNGGGDGGNARSNTLGQVVDDRGSKSDTCVAGAAKTGALVANAGRLATGECDRGAAGVKVITVPGGLYRDIATSTVTLALSMPSSSQPSVCLSTIASTTRQHQQPQYQPQQQHFSAAFHHHHQPQQQQLQLQLPASSFPQPTLVNGDGIVSARGRPPGTTGPPPPQPTTTTSGHDSILK